MLSVSSERDRSRQIRVEGREGKGKAGKERRLETFYRGPRGRNV